MTNILIVIMLIALLCERPGKDSRSIAYAIAWSAEFLGVLAWVVIGALMERGTL